MMGSFQLIEMKWVPDAERIWVRRSVLEVDVVSKFGRKRERVRDRNLIYSPSSAWEQIGSEQVNCLRRGFLDSE